LYTKTIINIPGIGRNCLLW